MSKIDISSKAFFSNSRNFADLVNGVVFKGRATIDPKDLESVETERISDKKRTSYYVDVSKRWSVNGMRLSIISIENQTYIDYGMIVRNMVTEALLYRKQLDDIKAYHKEKKDVKGNEFLSGIKKSEMLVPVVTVVFYFGEEPWDGPRQLYDLLDMDERLIPYVYNYQLNLYDYHDNKEEFVFEGEVGKVIESLRIRRNKEHTLQFINKNKYMKEKTAKLIGDILGLKDLEKYSVKTLKGEVTNMSKAIEEHYNCGVEEGKLSLAIALFNEGVIDIVTASSKCNLSEEEFKKMVKKPTDKK